MQNISKQKSSVLVVDDTPSVLELVVGLLQERYSLKLASSGAKALEYLEKNPNIDLILLDIMMPDMDGFEVCRRLKQNKQLKHIPIIFLTALEQASDIVRGFESGAVDYITKPFEPAVLHARVDTHVELKKLRDSMLDELQRKDALLVEQSKLASMGEMLEDIAHQWKQPLSVISMSASNMRVDIELGDIKSESLLENLDVIEDSMEHMVQTIADFKDFVQASHHPTRFDLHEVVQKVIALLAAKFRHDKITVHNNVESIEVCSYQNDFIQVLLNLFNNATEMLSKDIKRGEITLTSKQTSKGVELLFCDNGGGINEKILPKIFEKYTTTKTQKTGSGLGLYISKKIMQNRMDGDIRGYNDKEGACFELHFVSDLKDVDDGSPE